MYKLSIVVTVYNMQDFIYETLNSIYVQIDEDVEVVCVNDGSTDFSIKVIEQFLDKISKNYKKNFVLINTENYGVSHARNIGIKYAMGKYISFVDADDKILSGYIVEIKNQIEIGEFDILDFNMVGSNGEIVESRYNNDLESLFFKKNWHICMRVFSYDYISQYSFKEGIYYEDLELLPIMYLCAKNSRHIDCQLYWYRNNPNSITRKFNDYHNKKTMDSLVYIFHGYLNFNNEGEEIEYMRFYLVYLISIYSVQRNSCYESLKNYNKFSKIYLKDRGKFKKKRYMSSLEKLFLVFPKIFIILYSFYRRVKMYV